MKKHMTIIASILGLALVLSATTYAEESVSENTISENSIIIEEILSVEAEPSMTEAPDDVINAEIDRILSQLGVNGKSEYQKACLVANWILDNVTYDYDVYAAQRRELGEEPIPRPATAVQNPMYSPYTISGALFDKNTVCHGYSLLYQRMLQRAGMAAEYISGRNHAWNIVRINGVYYCCDITFADAGDVGGTGNGIKHDVGGEDGDILFGEKYFTSDSHIPNPEYATEEFRKAHPISWLNYGQTEDNLEEITIPVTFSYSKAYAMLNEINQSIEQNGGKALVMDKEWLDFAMIRALEMAVLYNPSWRPDGSSAISPAKTPPYLLSWGRLDIKNVVDLAKENPLTCIGIGVVSFDGINPENYYGSFSLEKKTMTFVIVGSPADYTAIQAPADKSTTVNITMDERTWTNTEMDFNYDRRDIGDRWFWDNLGDMKAIRTGEKNTFAIYKSLSDFRFPNDRFEWSSSDPNVITVDKSGNINAKNVGKAIITAKLGKFSKSVEIAVLGRLPESVEQDEAHGVQCCITNKKKKTAMYVGEGFYGGETCTIPETVVINHKKYKVTAISEGAFFASKKLKKVVIPKSVTKIGKNAFRDCVNLKQVVVKSKKLKKSGVGENAFKNAGSSNYKKLTIKVPKGKKKSYKKIFRSKGLSKKAKVK